MSSKRFCAPVLFVLSVLVFVPGFFNCELGKSPVGTEIDTSSIDSSLYEVPLSSSTGNMRIVVDPSELIASETDEAKITVIAYKTDGHTPLEGKAVTFKSTHGVIYFETDTTDSIGEAHATLRSVPMNAEGRVVAEMDMGDSTVSVAAAVTYTGVLVSVSPAYSYGLLTDTIPVTISVIDGAGQAVQNVPVTLTGAADDTGTTRGDGTFETTVFNPTPSVSDTVTIVASSNGATGRISIPFLESVENLQDTVTTIRQLRIFSSRSQIKANNSDQAEITAILTNERNNPLSGDTILFSTSLGVIDSFKIVDSTGRATATLTSRPINGECVVAAEVLREDTDIKDTIKVIFSGITLNIVAQQTSLSINDTTEVKVLMRDGSGNPIGGDTVMFSVDTTFGTYGTFVEEGRTGTLRTIKKKTEPNGEVSVKLTSSTAGTLTVKASCLNAYGETDLYFATNYLTVDTSKSVVIVGGNDSSQITATYKDKNGTPVSGVTILFASNAGTLTMDTVVTNSSGQAATWLKSANFSGTATVQATALDKSAGSVFIPVLFNADQAKKIELLVTPDNIGINGGIATLIATVKDSNDNMVSGRYVNFKIERGPGGGEYIEDVLVATYNGVARTELYAGSQASLYRDCEVSATVGTITAFSKMTISGEPHIVTVARPEDDSVAVKKAGALEPTTFEFNVGAVVQDINGNPVADGTKIQFSAVVSGMSVAERGFDRWIVDPLSGNVEAGYTYWYLDVPFEDINNDTTMNPNIDLKLDFDNTIARRGDDVNGDGIMDYNPLIHDFFYDFNHNGTCDPGYAEPAYSNSRIFILDTVGIDTVIDWVQGLDTLIIKDTVVTPDTTIVRDSMFIFSDADYETTIIVDVDTLGVDYEVYADLNRNGAWDQSELMIDHNGNGVYDGPASGDFIFSYWEMRPISGWTGQYFDFSHNDYAVVIEASTTTEDGIAETDISYPRQLARRLYVTVNAEANGVRDRDGERFILPQVKSE